MATTIASVATIQFPTTTRILRTSWCPDKDLLVVFSVVSHQTKMTLYKMQGGKKWEVTIQPKQVGKKDVDVVSVTWSPDGMCGQILDCFSSFTLCTGHSPADRRHI